MHENDTVLRCGNCNKETSHIRLSASEVKLKQQEKNSLKSRILNIVFGVLLGSHKSESKISYFKCSVCHAEYNDSESAPHGWG
ncbi:hypothetical protein AB6D11_26050 [Vibrio splendidus]